MCLRTPSCSTWAGINHPNVYKVRCCVCCAAHGDVCGVTCVLLNLFLFGVQIDEQCAQHVCNPWCCGWCGGWMRSFEQQRTMQVGAGCICALGARLRRRVSPHWRSSLSWQRRQISHLCLWSNGPSQDMLMLPAVKYVFKTLCF
jgi:hypothetical protein